MADITRINQLIQEQMHSKCRREVPMLEAAQWLERWGVLREATVRRCKALRTLMVEGKIEGAERRGEDTWVILRIDE